MSSIHDLLHALKTSEQHMLTTGNLSAATDLGKIHDTVQQWSDIDVPVYSVVETVEKSICDRELNEEAIVEKSRIFASYMLKDR